MIQDFGSIKDYKGRTILRMWKVTAKAGLRPLNRHSHIMFEIALIKNGSCVYTLDNKKYTASSGSMLVFSSNEQHCITEIFGNEVKIVNLHFEPQYLWGRSKDSLSEENFGFCFTHGKNFNNLCENEKSEPLRKLFYGIIDEFKFKKPEYELKIKSLVNLIIIELIRSHDYAAKSTQLSYDREKALRKSINYIDSHIGEPLSLNTLANIAGMSPNYFSTLFHSISGITLWDYISSRRIDTAINLLLNEKNTTILDIALQCGYNNTANFNKTFKKITGITPGEYKKNGGLFL